MFDKDDYLLIKKDIMFAPFDIILLLRRQRNHCQQANPLPNARHYLLGRQSFEPPNGSISGVLRSNGVLEMGL